MTAEPPDPREVGVGPWVGPWPPDHLVGTRLRPRPAARRRPPQRRGRYRYWTVEAVVADLDTRRAGVHVAIENWSHDLNIGSVVRTANAVNAAGVHVVGRRRWNRRGAMVTDRYLHVHHHPDAAALGAWAAAEGLPVIGLDNVDGAEPLETAELPERVVLLLGQEGAGLGEHSLAVCERVLHIAQFGSTRSLNAGAAAAIALHAWVRRWRFDQRPG